MDNSILGFNLNQPKSISSLSYNTVNQQHSPQSYDTVESTPASGNYMRTMAKNVLLNPAPRDQLGVPTNKVYKGNTKKFYKQILGNANWVRGNEFGLQYPYKKDQKFVEMVSIPSVKAGKGPVDYLGSNAKIVMRNNSPFYPYPSQKLLQNKNYWAYPHEYKYLNKQPIFNYGHGLMEGGDRGQYTGGKGYNPYVVEGFCGSCGGNSSGATGVGLGIGLVLIVIVMYIGFYQSRK